MKAIKVLTDYRYDIKARAKLNGFEPILDEVNEALAELQDLESYIEGQIAKYTKEGLAYRDSDNLQKGLQMIEKAGAYTDILQKIRGENDNR